MLNHEKSGSVDVQIRNCSKTVIKELLFGIFAKNCVVCPKYLKTITSPFKACPNYLKLVSAFCA